MKRLLSKQRDYLFLVKKGTRTSLIYYLTNAYYAIFSHLSIYAVFKTVSKLNIDNKSTYYTSLITCCGNDWLVFMFCLLKKDNILCMLSKVASKIAKIVLRDFRMFRCFTNFNIHIKIIYLCDHINWFTY